MTRCKHCGWQSPCTDNPDCALRNYEGADDSGNLLIGLMVILLYAAGIILLVVGVVQRIRGN